MMKRIVLLAALLWLVPLAAPAKEAQEMAEDPVLEKRMLKLSEELRCLVCQNESLAASRADLANDLRREVRDKMRAGWDDKQIIDYLVQRYGDFVLYNPPVKPTTALLWYGPFVLVGAGVIVLVFYLKRRRARAVDDSSLSAEEQSRVNQLLNDNRDKDRA